MDQLRTESSIAYLRPTLDKGDEEGAGGVSTLEKYEARIKKDVANDIRNLLCSTKAYVRHYAANPKSNPAHTKALAAPKEVSMHPETSLARRLEDPVLWAKLRAFQLEEKREAAEAAAAKEAKWRAERQRELQEHQERWHQASVQLMAEQRTAAKREAAYAAQVAKYVKEKATADLERLRERKAKEKVKAEELRAKVFPHQSHK